LGFITCYHASVTLHYHYHIRAIYNRHHACGECLCEWFLKTGQNQLIRKETNLYPTDRSVLLQILIFSCSVCICITGWVSCTSVKEHFIHSNTSFVTLFIEQH